jgi:hypothetical protein
MMQVSSWLGFVMFLNWAAALAAARLLRCKQHNSKHQLREPIVAAAKLRRSRSLGVHISVERARQPSRC